MAFGGFDDQSRQAPMADINVAPMVDVMLVLLVIFIIAAPLFTHAVKLELPQAQSAPSREQADTIVLSIGAAGALYWGDKALARNELDARLAEAAARQPQPALQLYADKDTRYETIAQIMSIAQSNGITRMGFVTDANRSPGGKE